MKPLQRLVGAKSKALGADHNLRNIQDTKEICMKRLPKIDIHVHTIKYPGMLREDGETYATPAQLIDIYDQIGVEKGVILPEIYMECATDNNHHREIQEIVAAYPDRFAWFCNLDPRQGTNSARTNFTRYLEYYKSLGAKGVGEICSNLYFDDPMMMNLFAHCEACDMPVIFHIGTVGGGDYGIGDTFGLPHLEVALKAFPKLRFLAHSQKFWSMISGDVTEDQWNGYPTGKVVPGGRLVSLMEKYDNLCCDLSAGSGYNAMSRDPAFTYGFMETYADRIYYGTDICAPSNIHRPMLKLASFLDEAMESGHISYETYEKISRGNALRILQKGEK